MLRAVLVRQHVHDALDRAGPAGRAVLGVSPLLHGQAEARGHRRPGRAVPAPVRQAGRQGQGLMPERPEPRYMGGQAVMEGVMMRGANSWAVAVRTPEGDIELETHDAPRWAERYARVPLVRGVMMLAEPLTLGFKALAWSATRQVREEERLSKGAIGGTIAVALAIFTGLFILLPAFGARGLDRWVPLEGFWLHAAEGALRLALFIGYLLLIGRLRDVKRVFQYHGAEHKAIAAYENGVEVTPESAQRFTTEHVRCGTNFLLTVFVITIVVSGFVCPTRGQLVITSE